MEYIASFDIGTTDCKGVLVARDGGLREEIEIPLQTVYGNLHGAGQTIEQNPEQWFQAVASISAKWREAGIVPQQIRLIAFSGQMQDCIPVDAVGNPVRPAILYSDVRAAAQSAHIVEALGEKEIRSVTGNHMDGSITLPKLLWLKENEPEQYGRTAFFLTGAKDYVIGKLTGRFVADPTTASTTGMMNLAERQWQSGWLERLGLDASKLPRLMPSDEIAGYVHETAAGITGFVQGTPVLCGVGDAGATTIGAGVTELGHLYAYIGTTGWVAATTPVVGEGSGGMFHLAHPDRDLLIAIAPLLNAGNTYRWALDVFCSKPAESPEPIPASGPRDSAQSSPSSETQEDDVYAELEAAMASCDREHSGVLFLPYLNGERCPVHNPLASGSFFGLRATTTGADMSTAVLEGVAFAMRQVMELIQGNEHSSETEYTPSDGIASRSNALRPDRLILIGGGSRSRMWNQIMADVFGIEVLVPHEAQYLPSLGSAAAGFVRLGWSNSYKKFVARQLTSVAYDRYMPQTSCVAAYNRKYEKFVRLYAALEPLYD